jgi:hypothetical protein
MYITRDKRERAGLVLPSEIQEIERLSSTLEEMIEEKYIRGCTLALNKLVK